ncbi:hypothetical protein C8A01DRAFT_12215 [Parachaetomium inaequale]|uniref:2EXR domain-containing protein n=1 Tax=Parachaetomium inaequale TaxID=2588326 RepID=A0AAN6SW90_9PEZI|nr:hypothetical protein C8A01DRAFT_12215 [Parachaetomium inaequale]
MDTFHPFPLLPFELRARIWQLTVEPRTVEVRMLYPRPLGPVRLVSPTPVPAPLQACREARNLKLYQQAFSDIGKSRYVWVNWDMDIISIGTSLFCHFHRAALLFKRLQFERENSAESFYHFEIRDLKPFINVQEIYIVCADGMRAWHQAGEELYHYWHGGDDNLYLIDLHEDGRMMRATEWDKIRDHELREESRQEGTTPAVSL